MKFAVVLFFVALATVVTSDESILANTQICATEFNISPEIVGYLINSPAQAPVTENLKCFTKCVFDRNQVVSSNNVVDIERLVALWKSHGRDEAVFHANYAQCPSPSFTFGDTCEGNWASYRCVNGF